MNAVVLFNYCMIKSVDDIELFYDHLFHGKTPDPILQQGLKLFKSLGTCDPLASTTNRIGEALVRRLEKETNQPWTFYIASKHTAPHVEDIAMKCLEDGVQKIITVPTTPLYAASGTKQYERKLEKALENETQISIHHVSHYYNDEAFIEVMANRLQGAIRWLPAIVRDEAEIVFVAHSLPGVPSAHKEFIAQFEHLAATLAQKVNVNSYQLSYRSQGPSPQKWLEPNILDVIRKAAVQDRKAIIACELLSVVSNAETIQEVGWDGQELAHSLNLEFVQTEYLNDSDDFISVLEKKCLEQYRQGKET